jgi:hypothetical protein
MDPSMPARSNAPKDLDILVLERALNWRAAPPLPWNSMAASLAIHMTFVVICLSGTSLPSGKPPDKTESTLVAHLFIPLVSPTTPRREVVLGVAGRLTLPPVEAPDAPFSTVAVNLSSIRLDFALDVGNQLPDVVAAQHGMLALVDRQDVGLALYILEPPEWKLRPTNMDISRKFKFWMDPPGKWPVFSNAANHDGIDLGQYIACAVFDAAFSMCLRREIQSHVAPGATGSVSIVTLAFAADRACGIEVREVRLAPQPIPEP